MRDEPGTRCPQLRVQRPKAVSTTWDLPAQTAVKHVLLRRYLDAWFPILGRHHNRLVYLDGFAGPGEYKGGEQGSPILAIESAKAHHEGGTLREATKILFLFVEADNDRADHLTRTIDNMSLPDSFEPHVVRSDFLTVFREFLDPSDLGRTGLAPTFALVDPFGFSGIPMKTMGDLLGNARCELLINLMVEPINRFLRHPRASVRSHIAETYGTSDVYAIAESTGDRLDALLALYKKQLRTYARYVGRFDMKPRRNSPSHSLFFASNHSLGFHKMKDAMWKADKKSGSVFRTGNQLTDSYDLFGHDDLQDDLLEEFDGEKVSIDDVEKFVIEETDCLPKHLRSVLKKVEEAGKLQVSMKDGGTRRGMTYPKGRTVLAFG